MTSQLPRCQVLPLPDHQVSLQIDGVERVRWHHGPSYPRPFFYPLLGPSGAPLTRMGHPGASNHDHHRSIWFAHQQVLGIDFWSDNTTARIRQKQWLHYQDGDEEAAMAVLLGWYDGHDPQELLEQELIAAVRPGPKGETLLELQATFRPRADSVEFGKTNFGFFAVRVAKSISEHFGDGRLSNSAGETGELSLFGRQAQWVDYSGPVPNGHGPGRSSVEEGITYFDHPANPGYPAHWHVREDGWMGASVCMRQTLLTTREQPLVLHYLLYAHGGPVDAAAAGRLAEKFAAASRFEVRRVGVKHQQFIIGRAPRT